MAETKRITVRLPNSLIREVDGIASMEEKNRNEFIKEAMRLYIKEKRRIQMIESMKSGYLEMSHINKSLCEMGMSNDTEDFLLYETRLVGCGTT